MFEAVNIFLTATDQSAPKLSDNLSPYTRMVWKLNYDFLAKDIIEQMYPPLVMSGDAVIPSLNYVTLHQLIHFKTTLVDNS